MDYKKLYESETGFKFETDVRELFTEAEKSDDVDIEELYKKLFREWRNDVKLITELSMCMNWKLREHYRKKDESLAELYNDLRMRVHTYAHDAFIWEDAEYYFKTTD